MMQKPIFIFAIYAKIAKVSDWKGLKQSLLKSMAKIL